MCAPIIWAERVVYLFQPQYVLQSHAFIVILYKIGVSAKINSVRMVFMREGISIQHPKFVLLFVSSVADGNRHRIAVQCEVLLPNFLFMRLRGWLCLLGMCLQIICYLLLLVNFRYHVIIIRNVRQEIAVTRKKRRTAVFSANTKVPRPQYSIQNKAIPLKFRD